MKLDFKKIAFALAAAVLVGGCGESGKPLVMITEATFPPYEYVRGHEIVGVDVEICKAVAKKLGRPLKCETADFDTVLPVVVGGRADIAAAGITITEDRKQQVDFSIPYVKAGLVVVYKKSAPYTKLDDLKGKRIGVQTGSTSEAYVLEHLGQAPATFSTSRQAVAAVAAGAVDFAVADLDPTRHDLKGQPDLAMSGLIVSEDYGIAIKKGGSPALMKAINEVIAEAKADGRLDTWITAYTAESVLLNEQAAQAD